MTNLHVKITGEAGKPNLLFLHGAATNSWMWEAQIQRLQDFRCISVDLPGHGNSLSSWQSLAKTAQLVSDLIKQHTPDQKAHVIGLSLGAYVVLELLAHHPDGLESAILSGATAGNLRPSWVMKGQLALASLFIKQQWFIDSQAKMLNIPADQLPDYRESVRSVSAQAFRSTFAEITGFSLPDGLQRSSVRTLVVAGDKEVPAIVDAVSILMANIPKAQGYLVKGVHHGWNAEAPDLFAQMVRAWATKTPLPDSLYTP
jgi:pimeloyl-ACP methyl ester carboxylesterase